MTRKLSLKLFLVLPLILAVMLSVLTPLGVAAQTTAPTATAVSTPQPAIEIAAVIATAQPLNARSGPAVTYESVALLSNGEVLVLNGRTANGAWVRIKDATLPEMWVNVQFVRTTTPVAGLSVVDKLSDGTAPAVVALVTSPRLNVRSGPYFTYGVVKMVNKDEAVGVIGRNPSGTWLELRLDAKTRGWVNALFLVGADRSLAVTIPKLPVTSTPNVALSPAIVTVGQAVTLQIDSFPASAGLAVNVTIPSTGAACTVATGRTNGVGAATINFVLPRECPRGTALLGSPLTLAVTTVDGKWKKEISVTFSN